MAYRPSSLASRLLLLVVVVSGCGSDGGTADLDAAVTDLPPYRPPTLIAVRPPTVSVGGAGFVLAADGAFDPDAIVLFDGAPLTTRVVSATAIEADVPDTAIAVPGPRTVQIVHTGDGGGLSARKRVDVIAGIAGPVLDVLVPDRLIVGNAAATIRVDGWNFIATSVVHWNGAPRPTTFVSSSQLRAAITATDFAVAGTAAVTVITPDAPPAAAPLVFTIEELPVIAIGVSGLVSVTTAGVAGYGLGGALSLDGRYVAFDSNTPTMVAGDGNSVSDVFVRDTCRGATGCTPSTVRVSVDTAGGDADARSDTSLISGTGRYVAFLSAASDLVAGAPLQGLYVRDTCIGATGCTPTTVLASILPEDGSVTSYGSFRRPAISRDGRFVAFDNYSAALGNQIFLSDTCLGVVSGCTPRVNLISRTLDGLMTSGGATFPALSADGRFVAFQSRGPALDGQPVTATRRHVYVLDTCHGATGCTRAMTRATVALDGSEANGFPTNVAISGDGRYVGFASWGTTWTAETNPNDVSQVFVRDTCIGATGCTPATTVVSAVGGSASNGQSYGPSFSASGRFVAFHSRSSDLVVNDSNGRYDVFVRDRCLGAVGCTPSVRRVSVSSTGVQGNDDSGSDEPSPWISGDGSFTAWASKASNLVANDSNTLSDVYVAGTGYVQ